MTGKEFYEKIGGDYDKMLATLRSDDMIISFAKMFLKDESFNQLKKSMEEESYEEAFKAAHSLKGVCLNMCYTRIGKLAADITEDLRGGVNIEGAKEKFTGLEAAYKEIIENINLL